MAAAGECQESLPCKHLMLQWFPARLISPCPSPASVTITVSSKSHFPPEFLLPSLCVGRCVCWCLSGLLFTPKTTRSVFHLSSLDADDMNRPGREVAAPTPAAMKRRSAVARCAGRRCHPLQGGFLGECGRAENFNEGCCSFLPDRRIVVETRPAATEALRWFVSHMRMK